MSTNPAPPLDFSNFAELYERWLVGPLFQPWAEILVDRTAPAPGEAVLDVACGTGIVARTVRARLGPAVTLVGVDSNPAMLATARAAAPDIDWRLGDARSLPLADDERFHIVICQQGLQFFPDKPVACREFRRALVPNGRLAVATWRPDDEIPLFRDLRSVAERHVGPIMDARHSFGEAEAITRMLTEAGFRDVQVDTVAGTTRFEDGAVLARLNTMALMGMSPTAKAMPEEQRSRTVSAIVQECMVSVLAGYADGDGIAFTNRTNVALARA